MFAKLIGNTQMTRWPSIYLYELMVTANKVCIGDERVRHKFIQALPTGITPVIAAVKSAARMTAGTLADKIVPFLKRHHITKY